MAEEEVLRQASQIAALYKLWAEIVSFDGKKCGINVIGSYQPNEATREAIKLKIDEVLKPLEARIAFVNDRDE